MPDKLPGSRLLTHLEQLESREVLSAAGSLVEAFQRGPDQGLPAGWVQWASDGSPGFRVSAGPGHGDQSRLVSNDRSGVINRAWVVAPFAANVETSAAVFLNSLNSVQLFVRGRQLNTATPSYYAVAVTRGAEVQLLRVVDGQTTSLGAVRTSDYLSNRWVTVTIRADGDNLRVMLHRGDTNQYLGSDGRWTRQPVAAIERADRSLSTAGQVGFARPGGPAGEVIMDSLRVHPTNSLSNLATVVEERFQRGTDTGLPAGWLQWQQGSPSYTTGVDETLRITAGSTATARAWINRAIPLDAQISSSIYVDSLIPAGLFARGRNVNTDRPSFYSVTLSRGLEINLNRVIDGQVTTLGTIRSRDWISGQWIQMSLAVSGNSLRVQVYRSDTGHYLTSEGSWSLTPSWALARTDSALISGNTVGLTRGSGYAGQLIFDNFIVTSAPLPTATPRPIPTEGDKPIIVPNPSPDLPGPIPPPTTPPPISPPPVSPPVASNQLPAVSRNYDHIRVANLAYWGTPFTGIEQSLIRNSVDLIIPNLAYLEQIHQINPQTPQFIYTNVSNIYLGLINDWNEYADRNRLDREGAFYHVNRSTPFNGMSASAVPVNRFWGVYRSGPTGWTSLTSNARNSGNDFAMAEAGQSVAIGFIEKYREMNWVFRSPATNGWAGQFEYVSAINSRGEPTQWRPLTLLRDGTAGFRRDGQMTFDPPRDWVPASIGGSARLYYVRVRTTSAGIAPNVTTLLGRDYTLGNRIPAFDRNADRDGDGYLNDAEYARRRSGMDARFLYESRLFYPNYGPMRFATNVNNPGFRNWAVDYHARFIATQPLARGFFVDNSIGRLIVDPTGLVQSLESYSADYGSLLGNINARLMRSGHWLIANTAGGNTSVEPIMRNGVSYLEEFALRPLTANTVQFEDLLATLRSRRQLSNGRSYEILDSLPQVLDANDPRMQATTLAMYYLLADPNTSFLMLNGGNEPNSSWTRHWFDAITYNVGRPRTEATLFATGADPSNPSLTYKVYQREYQNALILYKPLSYTRGQSGTIGTETATTHRLDGWYRPLHPDGTLGKAVRQITLRNGEGITLIKSS